MFSVVGLKRTACVAFLAAIMPVALANEQWPNKPIRMVVPFPPGGGTDIVARSVGRKLAAALKQSVVIDNKPGAATVIGADAVAKAQPDGYTLLLSGSSTYTVNPAIRPKMPYDTCRDLVPIAIVAKTPLVLLVSQSSPWNTLGDLITAAAKEQPRTVSYATFGSGSAAHLAGEMLAAAAGIQLQDVPYKGGPQATMPCGPHEYARPCRQTLRRRASPDHERPRSERAAEEPGHGAGLH